MLFDGLKERYGILGAVTISITTFSLTTFSINGLHVTVNITTTKGYYAECHYAQRCDLLIAMLNVVMLSVVAPFFYKPT